MPDRARRCGDGVLHFDFKTEEQPSALNRAHDLRGPDECSWTGDANFPVEVADTAAPHLYFLAGSVGKHKGFPTPRLPNPTMIANPEFAFYIGRFHAPRQYVNLRGVRPCANIIGVGKKTPTVLQTRSF